MGEKAEETARRIRAEITAGRWAPGQRLPGELALARRCAVSRETVRAALAQLAREGRIETKKGSGSRVRELSPRRIAVVPTFAEEYIFPAALRQAQEIFAAQGCTSEILPTLDRFSRERQVLTALLAGGYDGALIEGVKTALPDPNLDLYEKLARQIPLVFFHGCSAGVPGAVCVEDDNEGGGYLLTRYLLSLGHTAVGGVFKGDDAQGPARYAGYTAALRDAGLPLPDGRVYWYTASDREDLLDRGDTGRLRDFAAGRLAGCTAVVCYNGELARLLVRLLQAEGRRVPEDISVACFDASSYSDAGPLPLTTLTHGRESAAQHAALRLIDRMEGRPAAGERLPWVLIPRESTAKRREDSAWTDNSV